MEKFYTWLIWIWETENDLLFGSDVSVHLANRKSFDYMPKYEYNQSERFETRNRCTIYSCVSMLSYLFNKEICRDFIEKVWNKMIADWKLDPDVWAYLHDAVDYVRNEWNKSNTTQRVMSFRIDYTDKKILELLGNTVRLTQLGYRTSRELHNELQSNWFAMWKEYPNNGWHAVARYWLNIIDSYKWRNKFNRYSFHYFDDLVKNNIIMRYWYLYLKA